MTNVEYLEQENKIVIAIKVFTDDFETIVKNTTGKSLNTGKENEAENYGEIVTQYVSKNFELSLNNKKRKLEYVKHDINFEATWLYFNIPVNEKIKSIKLKQDIMNDMFEDQKNMVIITKDNNQKGYQLTREQQIVEVNWDE